MKPIRLPESLKPTILIIPIRGRVGSNLIHNPEMRAKILRGMRLYDAQRCFVLLCGVEPIHHKLTELEKDAGYITGLLVKSNKTVTTGPKLTRKNIHTIIISDGGRHPEEIKNVGEKINDLQQQYFAGTEFDITLFASALRYRVWKGQMSVLCEIHGWRFPTITPVLEIDTWREHIAEMFLGIEPADESQAA